MDKVIRVIQGANEILTCGQKVLSKLVLLGPTGGMEERGGEGGKGKKA